MCRKHLFYVKKNRIKNIKYTKIEIGNLKTDNEVFLN